MSARQPENLCSICKFDSDGHCTADDAKDWCPKIMFGHGPDGHNVTNAQYQAEREKREAAEAEFRRVLAVLSVPYPLPTDEWTLNLADAVKFARSVPTTAQDAKTDHIADTSKMVSDRELRLEEALIAIRGLLRDANFGRVCKEYAADTSRKISEAALAGEVKP
jgi:hypothetical protein